MTATTTRTKAPARVACPHCAYSAQPGSSIAGHVAMAHPDVPMDAIAPKRSSRNDQQHVPAAPVASPPVGAAILLELPLDLVDVGANVRVDVAELVELAASIAEHGVLQPIKATGPHVDGRYLVVWGQRRVLASRTAGRTTVPALVVAPAADVDDTGATRSVEQLVENLHRADLNPIDRARAMREVVDSGVSQADLARKLGIAPSTVANDLRLLELDKDVTAAIAEGAISAAHGKVLVGLEPKLQREITKRISREGASAHRTEELVRSYKQSEEWQRRSQAEEKRRHEAAKEARDRRIGELAKKLPVETPIKVGGGYYGRGQGGHVAKLLEQAGFTNVSTTTETLDPKPKGVPCDCTTWKVEINHDGTLSAAAACVKAAHRQSKADAERKSEDERRELQERVRDSIQGAVTTGALNLAHEQPEVARALLWVVMDWSLNDWVRDHKGDRKKPDAWDEISSLPHGELALEIAKYFRKGFTDRYNVRLDWHRLARELGVADDESPA